MPAPVKPIVSDTAPKPDPRVGLSPGRWDAGQAAWNIRLVSTTPPQKQFLGITNSDLAFTGKYAIQGNYNGFQIYDITNPEKPIPVLTYTCPASQSDVSVFRNLLFVSGEGQGGRVDCGIQGVPEPVSKERLRGIRIFDISDMANPKYLTNVQTCRGSHTHTVVTDPRDKANVYVYVSGSAGVRSADELPGCFDGGVDDPKSARFRIEVIKVPLAAPQKAAIAASPRFFGGLAPPPRRIEPGRGGEPAAAGAPGAGAPPAGAPGAPAAAGTPAGAAGAVAGAAPPAGRGPAGPPTGPNQCHDITVYPDIGFAGGACGGYGLLLNIREVTNPFRVDEVADINMSFWHSATFSNDGTKVLFTDEWGGGGQPRCRDTDKPEWGANALFAIEKGKMVFKSYYKLPAPQTSLENCVAHNGSLIPIPGREVMVQGWYQGGISVFDWTDPAKPFEVAFFDRGPVDATRMVSGGSWSVYLVQRADRQLRDRARARHLRAAADRADYPERDRRGQDGALRLPERAGATQVRLAGEFRQGARLSRSARTQQGPRRREDLRDAYRFGERREADRWAAAAGAEENRVAVERRGGEVERSGEGASAVRSGHRAGQRAIAEVRKRGRPAAHGAAAA